MFVVEVGRRFDYDPTRMETRLTTRGSSGFGLQITALALVHGFSLPTLLKLWPRGRGKAQADTLRKAAGPKHKRIVLRNDGSIEGCGQFENCAPVTLWWSPLGEFIPGDGEVIEGVASVDESAITGESAASHPPNPAEIARRLPEAPRVLSGRNQSAHYIQSR